MSGRDLRAFLCSHKASTFNTANNEGKMVGGYLAGVTKKNFKHVDYEQLLETVKRQKASGQQQLQKMKKLSKTSKKSRENALLRSHHEAWEKMHTQLVSAKVTRQTEVEMWKSKMLGSRDKEMKAFVLECTDLESQLYEERLEFERDTVDPIWSLRIDLKGWLEANSCPEEDRSVLDHEVILEQLRLVKEQQNRIQELLEAEYDMLQSDLTSVTSEYLPDEASNWEITRGIPQEAVDLVCPDQELKESALQEFLLVDGYYSSLLKQLEQSNKEVLSCSEHGGWSQYDGEKYLFITDQYSSSLPNRRAVVIDRLRRELPSKTRADIVAHESWCSARQHYYNMRKTHLKSWAQSKKELLARVVAAFTEAEKEYEVRQLAKEEREQQLQLCRELCEKVSVWRKEKLKTAQVEADLEAQRFAEEERQKQLEEQEKQKQHQKKKMKVKAYHDEMDQRLRLEREAARDRERQVEVEKKESLKVGKKRVVFRQLLEGERETERRLREARAAEEEKKKERRLEELRQQVQVNVATDPLRVLRETKSTHARQEALHELRPQLELQQPLYSLHSFTDHKLTSDLRFKVGEALRKAGLHTTDYGRRMLATIPPSHPPRPDQSSSLFKQ